MFARLGAFDHEGGGRQVLWQAAMPPEVEQGLRHEFAKVVFHGCLGFHGGELGIVSRPGAGAVMEL
ncbi:hypothetical protein GCM10027193_19150 [Arenimonas aestuarii]